MRIFHFMYRMRSVNAAVAMQKWRERLDKLEELKATNPNATLYECFYFFIVEMIFQWKIRMRVLPAGILPFRVGRHSSSELSLGRKE